MSYTEFGACLLVLGLAGFAQGVFGLGFAMIATPLLALFLDYRAAVLTAAIPLLVLACSWLIANRNKLSGNGLPWTLLAGIVTGAMLGVALQIALPQRVSLILLAALIVFSVFMPVALRNWMPVHRPLSLRSAPLFGALAGVTEAALNVGAPFMVLFGGLTRLSRLQLLVALNLCFGLGKTIQITLMMVSAPVTVSWTLLAAGVGASLAAFRLGDRLSGRFPEETFHGLLRLFLLAMAMLLVIRAQAIP